MLYYAYGSNLHIERMRARCPDAVPVERAWLSDHRLIFRTRFGGTGVATVVPAEGRRVPGGIYRISKRDMLALDQYEGFPHFYRREVVTVEAERSGPTEVLIYLMNDPSCDAKPHSAYVQCIIEGLRMWGIRPAPWLYRLGRERAEEEGQHACG